MRKDSIHHIHVLCKDGSVYTFCHDGDCVKISDLVKAIKKELGYEL